MSETNMPVAEVETSVDEVAENFAYELAFHILPTVAEGEVEAQFASVKSIINTAGGQIFDEEMAERIELAYEVVLHLEGKNRKFKSAYFGWIRFRANSEAIAEISNEVEHHNQILRHLLIKLTRVEEENPFRYHEAMKDQKMVSTVEESEVIPDFTTVSEEGEAVATVEEGGEVDDEALEKALKDEEV